MSDLVKKYQHYFNESVKLQETVNEQLAYITELEDAILELSEEPEINIPFTNKSISWGKEGELLKQADAKLAALRRQQDAAAKRTGSPKIEGILGEIEKKKGLDEVYRMTPERDAILKRERSDIKKQIDDSMEKLSTTGLTDSEHGLAAKLFDRNHRIYKIRNKTVQEATQADDEHGTVARVGRITKFLEKHSDPSKMKAHHLDHFFNHPDYFGETDEASDVAMKKLPVHHRKTIRAMRKDYYDLEW